MSIDIKAFYSAKKHNDNGASSVILAMVVISKL